MFVCVYIYIYIYIYIYKDSILSSKSRVGTIPSWTIKIFKNRILNLSNPSQELNVNKTHRASYSLKNKTTIGHTKIDFFYPVKKNIVINQCTKK